jgi:hypothetical protein
MAISGPIGTLISNVADPKFLKWGFFPTMKGANQAHFLFAL